MKKVFSHPITSKQGQNLPRPPHPSTSQKKRKMKTMNKRKTMRQTK
jgi:hypothetical protein